MGKGAASFLCRRATLQDGACSQVARGGAYGSDSGLGKRDIDRDCGGGGGAVVEVAVLVEAVPWAAEARRGGIPLLTEVTADFVPLPPMRELAGEFGLVPLA
jgi:hypothetical protein